MWIHDSAKLCPYKKKNRFHFWISTPKIYIVHHGIKVANNHFIFVGLYCCYFTLMMILFNQLSSLFQLPKTFPQDPQHRILGTYIIPSTGRQTTHIQEEQKVYVYSFLIITSLSHSITIRRVAALARECTNDVTLYYRCPVKKKVMAKV